MSFPSTANGSPMRQPMQLRKSSLTEYQHLYSAQIEATQTQEPLEELDLFDDLHLIDNIDDAEVTIADANVVTGVELPDLANPAQLTYRPDSPTLLNGMSKEWNARNTALHELTHLHKWYSNKEKEGFYYPHGADTAAGDFSTPQKTKETYDRLMTLMPTAVPEALTVEALAARNVTIPDQEGYGLIYPVRHFLQSRLEYVLTEHQSELGSNAEAAAVLNELADWLNAVGLDADLSDEPWRAFCAEITRLRDATFSE